MEIDSCRRKNLTPDRRVQHALMKRVFLHWLTFVGAVLFVSAILKSLHPDVAGQSFGTAAKAFALESIPFMVVIIAFMPAFLFDTHKISLRFAGPMFQFRRAMSEVVQGRRPKSICFRSEDFWHDLAVHFNQINERVGNRRSQAQPDSAPVEPADAISSVSA